MELTPIDALNALLDSGLTEKAVADRLSEMGAPTTQSTVHRLSAGGIPEPKFNLGMAILKLHAQVTAAAEQPKSSGAVAA